MLTKNNLSKVVAYYQDIPPQIFISQLNFFIRDNQPPRGYSAEVSWEREISSEDLELEEIQQSKWSYVTQWTVNIHLSSGTVRDLPLGYPAIGDAPLLRGPNHCRRCLCAPCIILKPPDFLRGSCDPHPANAEKRHMLYRKFWRCLKNLGVWQNGEYLRRKEVRTARDDRRDIMPDCVLEVRTSLT